MRFFEEVDVLNKRSLKKMKKRLSTGTVTLTKVGVLAIPALIMVGLSGCAAMGTAITHRHLTTQTKMSHTIFLNPIPRAQQTIYVRVGNTSGQSALNFSSLLKKSLLQRGYRVVSLLGRAHYLLQANIIKAGKTNPNNVNAILQGGYGDVIGTGLMGLGLGAVVGDSGDAMVAGGLIGAAAGFAADTLIRDKMYGMVTDVQLSERSKKVLHRSVSATVKQGNSAVAHVTSSGGTHWMRYRTRVVTTVDQVNLSFSRAKQTLKSQTTKSIAGLFV
jgi:hypothetical protein